MLERDGGPGAAAKVAQVLLDSQPDLAPTLADLLRPTVAEPRPANGSEELHLLPLDDLRRAVLGAIVNLLIEVLPTELDKLEAFLDNDHDTIGAELVTAGIREAQQMAREALQVAVRRSTELVGKL